MPDRHDRIAGVLMGTAVGDALGLPRENVSRRRAARLFGGPPLRYQFLLGRGMVSDDTEHTCLVGQSLIAAPADADRFARDLGGRLRSWLLALPCAMGRATLKSVARLCVGVSIERSGVRSAGNGPAMRSALLGVCLGDDPYQLRTYVRASTRLTHTDPRAERGALLVALAAHRGTFNGALVPWVREHLPDADEELVHWAGVMDEHLQRQASVAELADALGLKHGVRGYIYHTVPVALYAWLRHPGDFVRAVEAVIVLGGDADTTGAIVGGLMGATIGASGIPPNLVDGLLDWPFSVSWMRQLADRIADTFREGKARTNITPPNYFWPGLLVRNLLFLVLVLTHAGRRLLPPY
jgi:ADP-ribosylglycohydrolase